LGDIEEAAMTETIMPSFDRYAKEGNTIERLLAGYGELELEMCACVAATTNDLDAAIKKLFRTRGEKNRIKTADSMMTARYISAGLGTKYRRTLANMDWCRTVRNQYAHCNWYDTSEEGLCFVDLEYTAKLKKKIVSVAKHRYPIDATLLIQQEQYFRYVQRCFWYLVEAYKSFKGEQRHGRPLFTGPARIKRPLKRQWKRTRPPGLIPGRPPKP
jgi:hypothetical protein